MMEYKDPIELQLAMDEQKAKNKQEEVNRKKQYSHDWKITVFDVLVSAIAGGLMGLITSIIFWLITK